MRFPISCSPFFTIREKNESWVTIKSYLIFVKRSFYNRKLYTIFCSVFAYSARDLINLKIWISISDIFAYFLRSIRRIVLLIRDCFKDLLKLTLSSENLIANAFCGSTTNLIKKVLQIVTATYNSLESNQTHYIADIFQNFQDIYKGFLYIFFSILLITKLNKKTKSCLSCMRTRS